MARREPSAWQEAEALIAAKKAREYDQAVALLEDLCALAVRDGRADEARVRIAELRQRHANKPALLKRFDTHGLGR